MYIVQDNKKIRTTLPPSPVQKKFKMNKKLIYILLLILLLGVVGYITYSLRMKK